MKQRSRIALFTSIAVTVLLFGAHIETIAQHCPFDGGEMMVLELIDSDNKPMFGSTTELTLQEVDDPEADSCRDKKGLLSRPFLPPADALLQRYPIQGFDSFGLHCADCSFNAFGFYAVVLNQSERSCKIKSDDDDDYRWVDRKFEIRFSRDGIEQKIAVPPDSLFSMCTGTGKWSRFQPIKFLIKPVPGE